MYPEVHFIARGVGVGSLTPDGYDGAVDAIIPAAEYLAGRNAEAVMVIGTSLTFYRGNAFHSDLLKRLRAATGLPSSTMSQAIVDGLRAVGARQIAVVTAYADEVNLRLKTFLTAEGFSVLALEGFGLTGFGVAGSKSEADIVELASEVRAQAPQGRWSADLLRWLADAWSRQTARGPLRHSRCVQHPGRVLGSRSARRPERLRREWRPVAGSDRLTQLHTAPADLTRSASSRSRAADRCSPRTRRSSMSRTISSGRTLGLAFFSSLSRSISADNCVDISCLA